MLLRSIFIAICVLLADQFSKIILLQKLPMQGAINLLPVLDLSLARNHGAAFGILAGESGWQSWLFIGVAVVISIVILTWCNKLKKGDWWQCIALSIILGGAWGNMLDRLRLGHVTDFIDFHVGTWHWYTFNVADIGICVGAFMLIVASFRNNPTDK